MKNKTNLLIGVMGALLMGLTSCGGGTPSSAPSTSPSETPSIASSSEEATITKELTINYIDGTPIQNAKVTIFSGDAQVATGKTDEQGKFSFQGEKKAYTIDIESLPKGYTVDEDIPFPAEDLEYTVTASSEIITTDMPSTKKYAVGDIIYDFEFQTTKDEYYYLSDLLQEKDLVVINFWATWCNPCMSEFQAFNDALHGKNGDESHLDDTAVITMNTDISLTELKKYETTKTFFTDFLMTTGTNALYNAFRVSAIPTTVFVNKYGRIQRIHVGADTSYNSWRKCMDILTGDDAYLGTINPYEGKALVDTPDSGDLEAAACADDFTCTFEAPSQAFCTNVFGDKNYGTNLWPFIVDDEGRGIKASNAGYDGTYAATILTCTLKAGDKLVCDVLPSCEQGFDVLEFYSVANNNVTGYLSGVTGVADDWIETNILTADKAGTYQIFIFFSKDYCLAQGEDTAFIKNFHVA